MRHRPNYQLPGSIFDNIEPRWREELFRFIDSGDASPGFLDFLDRDVECQKVVEIAFTLVSQDVAATARQLKESRAVEPRSASHSMTATYARLFSHLLLALHALDDDHRAEVLRTVGTMLPPDHSQDVIEKVVNGIPAPEVPETHFVC